MYLFNLAISIGILWFLITFFTGSTNSSHSFNLAWIVIFGMLIVGLITKILLSGIIGPFTAVVDIAALYILVDKVCGTPQKVTLKICAWYLGISIVLALFVAVMTA